MSKGKEMMKDKISGDEIWKTIGEGVKQWWLAMRQR